MHSGIYEGWVQHHRHEPLDHRFRYPLSMTYLDLDELEMVFHNRWLWKVNRPALYQFRRADYPGPADQPLKHTIHQLVERELGLTDLGSVRLLTQLRTLGYAFNPISLFYVFDQRETLQAVVADVSNTPWNERHCYVVGRETFSPSTGNDHEQFRIGRDTTIKRFHVSPFMPMDCEYAWEISQPQGDLTVRIESYREGRRLFDARLDLRRREITTRNLVWSAMRYPLMPQQTIARIYWQALKLWWRRLPYVPKVSSPAHLREPQNIGLTSEEKSVLYHDE